VNKALIRILLGIPLLVFSCTAAPRIIPDTDTINYSFDTTLINHTNFDIEILDDTRVIPRHEEKKIHLPMYFGELNEGYRINYRVPLMDDIFIRIPREENIIINQGQISATVETADFKSDVCFLILQNNGTQTISIKMDSAYLVPLVQGEPRRYGTSPYLGPGKTQAYEIKPGRHDMKLETDQYQTIALDPTVARSGCIYRFLYKGNEVSLTDARPIQRIGESGWVKMIPNATGPMPLVAANEEIDMFIPTEQGIVRTAYDSAGNSSTPVINGDGYEITFADHTGDGFIISGYEKLADGDIQPIARIHNLDGTTRHILEPSKKYWTGSFSSAARQNDTDTWLLAGSGAKTGTIGNTAYATLVQEKNNKLTASWELGGKDFYNNTSGIICGEINSVVYDQIHNLWLVTGANNEFDSMKNPVKSSFIAEINNDGTIQKIDNSFKAMSFYKILTDSNGNCYFAGEEQRGDETYAVIIKYNIDNGQSLRISTQPPSHSYYHTAFFDSIGNHFILAGVLGAENEYGQKGLPFIEAVDAEKGTLQWREILSDPSLAGASLVTAIVSAPDYGFVVTLSGIAENYEKPFFIARLNSQGKLLKE